MMIIIVAGIFTLLGLLSLCLWIYSVQKRIENSRELSLYNRQEQVNDNLNHFSQRLQESTTNIAVLGLTMSCLLEVLPPDLHEKVQALYDEKLKKMTAEEEAKAKKS
jgi:hypothetical protein